MFGFQGRGWWKDINWWDAGREVACLCTECRPGGTGKGKRQLTCLFCQWAMELKQWLLDF